MTDAEYAASIQDICQRGATISAIKCFVESIRKDEREKCKRKLLLNLIAAGLVSEEKITQAHEIVRKFDA